MAKKILLTFFVAYFFLISNHNQAQQKTIYDQLVHVNQEWKNQSDINSALSQQPTLLLNEQQLIKHHLSEAEKLLRNRKLTNLSTSQVKNRLKNLDVLHQYLQAGIFPINTHHAGRQPYFIDDFNNYCAVGYLMKRSGADNMATDIHNTQNYNYLADIQHPDLMDWVANSGLTFDELALIQPGYGYEWPACIIEMHYNNTGTDVNEYIEVHQSNGGLIGMYPLTEIRFYDHSGAWYKTLTISQMQSIVFNGNQFYSYQFPSNESFADSGRVMLYGGYGTQTPKLLSVLIYNSTGLTLEDHYDIPPQIRQFGAFEDETTPIGSSLTFCGNYSSSTFNPYPWNPSVRTNTIGSVDPCVIFSPPSNVPVTLMDFTFIEVGKKILLNWQTASESNNDYFEIQRSADGVNFTTIGKVKGAGTSNEHRSYAFTDKEPQYLNHYRLKQVDLDGKFSFSKILFVRFLQVNPITIKENPVRNILQLQLKSNQTISGKITIYDFSGKVIQSFQGKRGNQTVDVSAFAAGKYLIRFIANNGEAFSSQFIKL